MKLVQSRKYSTRETTGCYMVLDEDNLILSVKTIELPYLENQKRKSCIPPGEYDCERIHHLQFGVCFWIKDVPNRDGILIHIGNYVNGKKIDTTGCILPGLAFTDINKDGFIDVADSTKAMDMLRAILPTTFKLLIL